MGALIANEKQLSGRVNMHNQSLSKWAPKAPGFYSQFNILSPERHKWVLMAGMIGFEPGLMKMIGSVEQQFD